jgi:hypothetical protein
MDDDNSLSDADSLYGDNEDAVPHNSDEVITSVFLSCYVCAIFYYNNMICY